MQLELSFPVIFKMLITGFGLAQKVSVVELYFQITTSEVDVICAVYLVLTAFECLKLGIYCRKKQANHNPYILLAAFNLSMVLLWGVLLLWLIWSEFRVHQKCFGPCLKIKISTVTFQAGGGNCQPNV